MEAVLLLLQWVSCVICRHAGYPPPQQLMEACHQARAQLVQTALLEGCLATSQHDITAFRGPHHATLLCLLPALSRHSRGKDSLAAMQHLLCLCAA